MGVPLGRTPVVLIGIGVELREVVFKDFQELGSVGVSDPDRGPFRFGVSPWADGKKQPARSLGSIAVAGETFELVNLQRIGRVGTLKDDHAAEGT